METLLALFVAPLFCGPGWLVLERLTIGRYPPAQGIEHNAGFVITTG